MRWEKVGKNPTLHPKALLPSERGDRFKWHRHAHSPRSSQAFCVSAFGTLRRCKRRDHVMAALLSTAFPDIATRGRPRRWDILLECEDAALLGEHGTNQPTSIDVLCVSSEEVVCIESKFLIDAKEGFSGCGQAGEGHCCGHFGPGSDAKTGTSAWCRLENWEGQRSPRHYWSLGKTFFRPEVFCRQDSSKSCPFRSSNYQLMRNFLFAATYAEREKKSFFGVLTICPRTTSAVSEEQVQRFRRAILQPQFQERVISIHYETYIDTLRSSGDLEAADLAGFLGERIATLIGGL